MADKLIFPVGFDLDKGVKEAIDDWKTRASKKLEEGIAKTPVGVKLSISDSALKDLQSRFDKIKINPLTADTKASIRELAAELRELAKALESVQKVKDLRASADPNAVRAARIAATQKKSDDQHEESLIRQRKLTAQAEAAEIRREKASSGVTREYKSQTTYLERLVKRMAVYTSLAAIGGFLTKIREVTAQFELQRVSLGAIIQNQTRANQLFSEIKQFALKSPLSVLDLTTYTKQVAAYRIETEKLFDTTKRLADVSVGLGVDMGRLVLAYGQVKAASYLRAAEIRQFTEAGIPLLELLAEKFTKLNGEAVTTNQVMDMVSKRMVGFEMVEEIFNDMTSAGGMFYNMQEKQGNTLFGLWAKLGDAASVMYDEIGNTGFINSQMKELIGLITSMMRSWRSLAREIGMGLAAYAVYALFLKKVKISEDAQLTSLEAQIIARQKYNATLISGSKWVQFNAKMTMLAANAQIAAANATNLFARSFYKLKAALLGNWMTAILVAVGLVIEKLWTAYEESHRLQNAINDIKVENVAEQTKSVRNFEYLAEAAVNAADGSKKQKDALDELQRTYKDMVPVEKLSLENLRSLNHEYESLTNAVRQYIQEQMKRKAMDEIIAQTGTTIVDMQREVSNSLAKGIGIGEGAVPALKDTEIGRFWAEYERLVKKGVRDIDQLIAQSYEFATNNKATEKQIFLIKNLQSAWESFYKFGANNTYLESLTYALAKQNDEINNLSASFSDAGTELGSYQDKIKELDETIQNATFSKVSKDGKVLGGVDRSSYLYQQMKANLSIKKMGESIKEGFDKLKLTWDESMGTFIEQINAKSPEIISALDFGKILAEAEKSGDTYFVDFIKALQDRYNEMIPQDVVVQTTRKRLQDIVKASGDTYDKYVKYQMGASQTLEEYKKDLKGNIDGLKKQVKGYLSALEQVLRGESVYAGQFGWGMTADQIKAKSKELQTEADNLEKLHNKLPDFDKDSGSRSDARLNALKEEMSLTKKLYDEYVRLEKQLGNSAASAKIQEIYANTIKALQDKAGKYGFKFELPFTDENLKKNMRSFIDEMKRLQKVAPKSFPNIGKDIDEAVAQLEDIDMNTLQKKLEERIKQLADNVAKTKTAEEFFDKILSQTGDVEIATSISLSVYGDTGEGLFNDMVEQIRQAFESENIQVGVEVESAIDETNQFIDYKKLADIYKKYQDDIVEASRKTAQEIISNGQKTAADNILNWEKEYAKAKSYEQKRTDIIKTESENRKSIIKATTKENAEEMARLLALSYEKQAQDLAKLSVEEFKNSDDYIKVFQDLDAVSGATLDRLQKRLEEMIATVKDTENVEGLKTLVDSLEKIRTERISRNPIEGIINSFKNYRKARQEFHAAEINESNVRAAYETERVGLENAVTAAKIKQAMAAKRVADLTEQGKQGTVEFKQAQTEAEKAAQGVSDAIAAQGKAYNKVKKAAKETTDAQDKQKKAATDFKDSLSSAADALNASADAMRKITDLLGIAEDSELGDIANGMISGFQTVASVLSTILAIMTAIQVAASPLLAIGAAVGAVAALFNVFSGSKVRKANKEIKRQQKLIDALEYSYSRLEKRAEKVFGSEYIDNYNARLKALQAQAEAYRKQAEAERSKGKKADKDKIKEYEEAYRDTMDEIADMQNDVSQRMLGTDLTSAARDFASAWIEAYKEFGSTTDAIKEKFDEMMQNLIIESVLGRVMEVALKPVFDMIDGMSATDFNNKSFWSDVQTEMERATENMDSGAQNIINMLQSAGIALGTVSSDMTGISRDIASASEESINGLATGINTQNFYIAQIHASVQGIYALMAGGSSASGTVSDTSLLGSQHLAQLPTIAQNTADTVARLDAMTALLSKVIRPKASDASYVVSTKLIG